MGRIGLIALVVATWAGEPRPEEGRLRAHVATLASPAFEGRRGEGAARAAGYIEKAFRDLGLGPLFGESYEQPIPGRAAGQVLGRNVGAVLIGSDPELRDEWIIVSAHFDHLGVRNGVLYPGADDNASGVAMMLEVARSLARSEARPRRSVMFVGFDLEEDGLWGSRHFVGHPPVPLDKVALFLTADLIGGSLGGVCERSVFVFGTEHAPGVRPWVAESAEGLEGLDVGMLGTDLLLIDRSDYGPFRARQVPYLFFSTGEHPRYHRPGDTADRVDYPKLEAISRLILGVVRRAADAEAPPRWQSRPENSLDEAVAVRDVLRRLLAHRERLKIKPPIVAMMTTTLDTLDGVIARRAMTPGERSRIVRVAQIVLFSVL